MKAKEPEQSLTGSSLLPDSRCDLTLPNGSATPLHTLKQLASEIRDEVEGAEGFSKTLIEKLVSLEVTASNLLSRYWEQQEGSK